MLLNEILLTEGVVKTNKNGEQYISVKCPSLNQSSEKEAEKAKQQMFKHLDSASVDFTGAKISKIFEDGNKYRLYEKYFFVGANDVVYYWTGDDTENPRGFKVLIVKANEESIKKSKGSKMLKAEIVGTPTVTTAKGESSPEDPKLAEVAKNLAKTLGLRFRFDKSSGRFFLRTKNVHDDFDYKKKDLSAWKQTKVQDKNYSVAFQLKSDPTIKLHISDNNLALSRDK